MLNENIKIPKDRIAVLIGKKGITKRKLEKELGIKIKVNSETGDITISSEDSLVIFNSRIIIQAIARGFNPKVALSLLDEENYFDLIDISQFSKKTKGNLQRLRSRVIGTEGRARENIENLTHTNIVVYGKTVGIIGRTENVVLAKRAIENLLRGSKHGNVYAMLERAEL